MKIVLIAIMMAVSLSVHASCGESEMLSQQISYKLDKDAFVESVRKTYGDRIVDLGFYSDILSDFSREELIDQKIENHFRDQLELSFSCGEIKELSKFSNSDLGKKFFTYYLAAMNSAGDVSLESGLNIWMILRRKLMKETS